MTAPQALRLSDVPQADRPDRPLPPTSGDRAGTGEPLIAPGAPEAPHPNAQPATVHRVRVQGCTEDVPCPAGDRLLVAFERAVAADFAGVFTKRIPVGCRRGGCGVCRVRVLEGTYTTAPMSADHVSDEDRQRGIALACCVYPESDLLVEVAPRAKASARADQQTNQK